MSPRPSRTVTGVFTSATCTLTLACVSLGGNCTSTPGFGAIGPEGACARAGIPAMGRRSARGKAAVTNRPISPNQEHKLGAPPTAAEAGPATTSKSLEPSIAYTLPRRGGVYLIRRTSGGRRCRKPRRFLQSRFVSTGEKNDVRRKETEAPARAEGAA